MRLEDDGVVDAEYPALVTDLRGELSVEDEKHLAGAPGMRVAGLERPVSQLHHIGRVGADPEQGLATGQAGPQRSGVSPSTDRVIRGAALALTSDETLTRRIPGGAAGVRAGLIVLSGATDMMSKSCSCWRPGTVPLVVSAVLVSLYPVVVVVLARVLLRERLTPLQAISVALALTAGALLAGR